MEKRPGVAKGRDVPTPSNIKEVLKDPAKAQKQAEEATKWVQAGMKQDAK